MTNPRIFEEDFEEIFNPVGAFIRHFNPKYLNNYVSLDQTRDDIREKYELRQLYVSQTTKILTELIKNSPEIFANKNFNTEQLAKDIANKFVDEVLKIFK